MCSGGIFDYDLKKEQLAEVELELAEPSVWDKPEIAQQLGRQRASLEGVVLCIDDLERGITDTLELLEMVVEENDADTLQEVESEIASLSEVLAQLEFRRMFAGPMDPNHAFLDIQAGSGGTEAQDWANMLLRMYIRYAERKEFKVEVLELSEGEIAGIKGATSKLL
mgnify:CR=1 FL=1